MPAVPDDPDTSDAPRVSGEENMDFSPPIAFSAASPMPDIRPKAPALISYP